MKEIKIHNPHNLPAISFKKLKNIQGDLKMLSSSSLGKLERSIINHGIFIPKFVWINEDDFYILDGNQTRRALRSLEDKGYDIPPIPYVSILATDKNDAKEKLLQINSRYGEYNLDTSFFDDMEKGLTDIIQDIKIPELDEMLESLLDQEDATGEGEDGEWVLFTCKLPKLAMLVVESELDRIKGICQFTVKDESIKNGLALEKMAMNSNGIPIESLE